MEGTWVWTTGEPWSYTNWDPGEPNNLGPENYLAKNITWKGVYDQWNDEVNAGYSGGGGNNPLS